MIKIHVKQKHIKAGIKGNCSFCPVALAVKEHFGNDVEMVRVGALISVHHKHRFLDTYRMSRSVERFISKFDTKKKVKPFNFFLK